MDPTKKQSNNSSSSSSEHGTISLDMCYHNPVIEHAKQRVQAFHNMSIEKKEVKVLLVYTGGTFGMANSEKGYTPRKNWLLKRIHANTNFFDKKYSKKNYEPKTSVTPKTFLGHRIRYHFIEYDRLIDSSELNSKHYTRVAETIEKNYGDYDSFIIIYGTDTMAYMASQLSFMLENLNKTVVITGSQIPISEWRNDAEANLTGAFTACEHRIPEVLVFFNGKLLRGNRAIKQSSTKLDAFDSPNLPPLANFDVYLNFKKNLLLSPPPPDAEFSVFKMLERRIALITVHPLLTASIFLSACKRAKAIVLQTYGMGNFPMDRVDLCEIIEDSLLKYNKVVVLVSQCKNGFVRSTYASSVELKEKGAILAEDMTIEAVIAKLSYVMGKGYKGKEVKEKMLEDMRGEIDTSDPTGNIAKNTPEMAQLMMKYGEEGEGLSPRGKLNRIAKSLQNSSAANPKQQDSVQTLKQTLNEGEDINKEDESGKTILHRAAINNDEDLVEFICNQEDADLSKEDGEGNSPIFYA